VFISYSKEGGKLTALFKTVVLLRLSSEAYMKLWKFKFHLQTIHESWDSQTSFYRSTSSKLSQSLRFRMGHEVWQYCRHCWYLDSKRWLKSVSECSVILSRFFYIAKCFCFPHDALLKSSENRGVHGKLFLCRNRVCQVRGELGLV
jgi:hypothetical protein